LTFPTKIGHKVIPYHVIYPLQENFCDHR